MRPSPFQGVAEPFEAKARFVCFFLNAARISRVAMDAVLRAAAAFSRSASTCGLSVWLWLRKKSKLKASGMVL